MIALSHEARLRAARWLDPRSLALFVAICFCLGSTSCGYRAGLGPKLPREELPVTAAELAESLAESPRGDVGGVDAPGEGLTEDGVDVGAAAASAQRSIGIQLFGNESLLPNLERDLHVAFSRAARRHAAMRLVSPERADLFIRGRIAGFRRGAGARTAGNQAVETLEIITIEAELVDGTTGKVVGRAQAQPAVGTAIDTPGREVATRERAVANAADRLLLLLLAGFEYGVTRPGDPLLPEVRSSEGQLR